MRSTVLPRCQNDHSAIAIVREGTASIAHASRNETAGSMLLARLAGR
jgi:hypothetical protein